MDWPDDEIGKGEDCVVGEVKSVADLERNKQVVVDFYTTAFGGNPAKAIADHLGRRYIQHNPVPRMAWRP